MNYNPQKIEQKWQKIWEKMEIYRTSDRVEGKKNFYCLDMFPYPSGEGLHVGHLHGYIGSDVFSRYLRMKGFNVLHPMGFDAFGLPAENAAIKRKIHPKTWTYKNIKQIRKQLKSVGACYDWEREVITSEPEYYKWTQWMFLQLYKAGLAYRAKIPCNFCPSCKTVLANEQVIEGKCERCDSQVIQKEIEQWLFKITALAEELLKDLENLDSNPPAARQGKSIDWPEATKIMQKNWIGRSVGVEIEFRIKNLEFRLPVFTTRPDTLFGATYLVLAPEHPIIEILKEKITNYKFVKDYIEESKKKTERERISETKEKTGIEIKGVKAINPANSREIPIFVADYVLIHYGTGAIMAVPGHDRRDFDFAKKYNLPIIEVIKPFFEEKKLPESSSLIVSNKGDEKAFEGEGILVNSGRFSGLKSEIARERIGQWLSKSGLAKKATYYKFRDWIISRQRYWGAPIPMIFCQKCALTGGSAQAGWQPVLETDLPVLLPRIRNFRPTGEGKSPLDRAKKFVETVCPKCQGPAQRETDTMDTFVCSSWYFLRYTDPKNEKIFASKNKLKTWLPVNLYVGGAEHACLHLLYARFFIKVLKNLGYLDFKEPFSKLRHQGTILGPDGQKMSKSRGNVITIEGIIKKYGTDTLRLYEMFMGPFTETAAWDIRGIEGCSRFLQKIWKLAEKKEKIEKVKKDSINRLLHQTIRKVSEDIENFRFNTAISALMILVNQLTINSKQLTKNHLKTLLLLLSSFAPHISEELWQRCISQSSIHFQTWPKYDKKLIEKEKIILVIQVNGRVRDKIEVAANISEKRAKKLVFSRERIKKWLGNKKIKKTIFVPKKLINLVV
jgi:leucyl-tRNA synthetase